MPDPRARELRTATGPRGPEDGQFRGKMAKATAGSATLARPILPNRSPTRPRKSRCSGCALGRLQSALGVPSGRSGGTLGATYRKVAVRPAEKCLSSVRSMAGPPERISVSKRHQRWQSNAPVGGRLRQEPADAGEVVQAILPPPARRPAGCGAARSPDATLDGLRRRRSASTVLPPRFEDGQSRSPNRARPPRCEQ